MAAPLLLQFQPSNPVGDLLANFKSTVRLIDLIDVLIVTGIVYWILLLIRGTRAVQMLTGLGVLLIGFFVSAQFELSITHWILKYLFDYLILIVIVLFQDDLRRALTHVGKNPFFSGASLEEELAIVDEICLAAVELSKKRMGALMVLERETGLKNFIDTGSTVDANVRADLIYSIFLHDSPIHDGAVVISEGRIAAAGCFLPLSMDAKIDKKYGTRHRAALGITEGTDAIVVLVSEETGQIHFVMRGKMTTDLTESELRDNLVALLNLRKADRGSDRENSRASR